METQGSQFSSLQCKHCGNEIAAGMNFCGNCGQAIPAESSPKTSAPVNLGEQVKTKAVKTSKIVLGIILGLIIFAIAFKIIFFLVAVIGALGLGAIGIHVSENPGAHNDLESFANILGFIGGAYLFYKIYKRVT
ncbi:MAG: zinc ribbon domain-containing protein [Syntrophales bacterium]